MSVWRDHVIENPMKIEIQRAARKFFLVGKSTTANSILIALLGICYIMIFLVVTRFGRDVRPYVFTFIEAGVYTVIAPTMMYSSIAGERERRTWDILRVAPVTKSQLVIGKYLAAVTSIGATALVCLPMILLTWANQTVESPGGLWIGELVAISYGLFLSALVIMISSMCRRSYVALGVSALIILAGLVLLPLAEGALLPHTDGDPVTLYLNPFYIINSQNQTWDNYQKLNSAVLGWPQILIYVLGAAGFLYRAIRSLTKVDEAEGGSS